LKEAGVENAYPRLSKDGRSILYQSNKTGKWQLFTCDILGANIRPVTKDSFNNNFPDWSADNQWIAFVSDRDGSEDVWLMRADGAGLEKIIAHAARDIHPYFSPDGQYILFNSDRNDNEFDIYRYSLRTRKTERITQTADNETCARYAPDMGSMVLLRNSASADDVFVMNASTFIVENISNTPDFYHGWPMYSHDGKWIYYSSMENSTYSIYRITPADKEKEQVTAAAPGEEHARVCLSQDGTFMVFNIRKGNTISIVSMPIE
jgi:TolB protein